MIYENKYMTMRDRKMLGKEGGSRTMGVRGNTKMKNDSDHTLGRAYLGSFIWANPFLR